MSKEAYVSVKEVIMTAPSTNNVSNTSNIGGVIVSEVGPRLAYIESPAQFLETYTKDGVTVPRDAHITFINAYYLSYAAGLVIARSMNTTATSGVLFFQDSEPVKVIYKDGDLMSKSIDITLTFEDPVPTDCSFVLNGYVFYKGDLPANKYDEYQDFAAFADVEDIVSTIEGWDDCHCSYSRVGDTEEYKLTVLHDPSIDFQLTTDSSEIIGLTVQLSTVSDAFVTPTGKAQLFSLRYLDATGDDSFTVQTSHIAQVTTGEPVPAAGAQQFDLTIDAGDGNIATGTYVCSMHPGAVDANGQSIYIDYLNTMDLNFEVVVFEGTSKMAPAEMTTKVRFGDSGLNLEECAKTSYLMAALTYLEDQEKYDIEYLAPFGVTAMPFVKRFTTTGAANKWFTPCDTPYTATNIAQIKRYWSDLGVDNSNIEALGCFDKNTSLTGWVNYIACSTLYYEKVMANRAYNAEFAPVFKDEYGTVNMTNPVKELLKSERQLLLDLGKRVNWIAYNQRTQTYYLNDNVTHYSKIDIVSEEQNRRLVNKVQKDLIRLLDQFLGKYNTRQTRLDVSDAIETYLRNNIMNKKFPPEEFQIICDESNNPASIIRENKLAVTVRLRLYNAIKYIEVLNEVYPLGVDFTSSN